MTIALESPRTGHQTAPDRALRWGLILLALPGFANPGAQIPVPRITFALDALIVLVAVTALFAGFGRSIGRINWLLVPGAYLAVKGTMWALGAYPAAFADLYQAYKAFAFLLVLGWFVKRQCFTPEGLARTVQILVPLFLAKYTLSLSVGKPRPVVWHENNFELMLLIAFFYLAFEHLKHQTALLAALVAVVGMSASRSSLVELCIVVAAIYWRPSHPRFVWFFLPSVGVAWYAMGIIAERTVGGVKSTDRYHFFEVFRGQTQAWGWQEWLVGTPPLSPLTMGGCADLSYYRNLFVPGTDTCYSVVFHAFSLRAIYDHGFLGAAFLLVFLWAALRRSGVGKRDVLVLVVGIGTVNAASVSSFNSEFLLIPLIVAAGLARTREPVVVAPAVAQGPAWPDTWPPAEKARMTAMRDRLPAAR